MPCLVNKKLVAICTSLACSRDQNSANKSNGRVFTDLKRSVSNCPYCNNFLVWKMPPRYDKGRRVAMDYSGNVL